MKQVLFSLTVRCKRDLVQLRQQTRRIAALLGFADHDQASLAAGVFALACRVHKHRATWNFCVENRYFCICLDRESPFDDRIQKRLPEQALLGGPDVEWVARKLSGLLCVDVFGEIQKLNQELLSAHLALQALQKGGRMKPAA